MPEKNRQMVSLRLDKPTREALEAKAKELGTSQANALGIVLGAQPESAYAKHEKAGPTVIVRAADSIAVHGTSNTQTK